MDIRVHSCENGKSVNESGDENGLRVKILPKSSTILVAAIVDRKGRKEWAGIPTLFEVGTALRGKWIYVGRERIPGSVR